jgi:hypothetical protein
MYTSILFAKLHIHAGHDVDSNTLSKTIAVYENDLYVFNEEDNYISAKELKKITKEKALQVKGSNSELYHHFIWNLN